MKQSNLLIFIVFLFLIGVYTSGFAKNKENPVKLELETKFLQNGITEYKYTLMQNSETPVLDSLTFNSVCLNELPLKNVKKRNKLLESSPAASLIEVPPIKKMKRAPYKIDKSNELILYSLYRPSMISFVAKLKSNSEQFTGYTYGPGCKVGDIQGINSLELRSDNIVH